MLTKKISALLILTLVFAILACAKEQKAETPKQEQVVKNLVPPKAEVKGPAFLVELKDLKVVAIVDKASKEIVETPSLQGYIKITNISKDTLDIRAVTLEYLDEAGKQITFKSGEKIAKAHLFLMPTRPGEFAEGSLDALIPREAIKQNTLGKIEINLVYVPSLLKREAFNLPEKIE
jgi:hypothetical protein